MLSFPLYVPLHPPLSVPMIGHVLPFPTFKSMLHLLPALQSLELSIPVSAQGKGSLLARAVFYVKTGLTSFEKSGFLPVIN